MIIQIDSREKARAIKKILAEFDRQDIKHPISKLLVGDYMNSDHERFRREMLLAQQNEIQLIFLCEHGKGIKSMADVMFWENPRRWKRRKNPDTGRWEEV